MSNSILKEDEESIPVQTAIARWADRAFKAETERDRLRAEKERLQGELIAERKDVNRLRNHSALRADDIVTLGAEVNRLRADNERLEGEISTTMTMRLKAENDRLRAEKDELLMFIEAGLGGMAKSNPLIAMHLKALFAKAKTANDPETEPYEPPPYDWGKDKILE